MKEFENKVKKIDEVDLDIIVNVRWDGFPYSYSEDKIRVYNIKIVHKPTGLTASVDSNTGIDTGYKYALNELEKKYTKLVLKKKLPITNNTKDVVSLIKYALERLSDTELSEENGWTNNDIKMINELLNKEFTVQFIDK